MSTVSEGDADSIDLDELLFGGGVTVIEWGHLLGEDLPDSYLELEILKEAEGRCLHFTAHGSRAEQLIKELQDGGMSCVFVRQRFQMLQL